MPGFDVFSGTGVGMGSGYTTPGVTAPAANGAAHGLPAAAADGAHFSVIGIVLIAMLGLVLLDRGGFRFVVTVGRS